MRLDAAPVALRHPAVRERFRLAARAVAAFRSTLDARGFTEIQTPKIVATATEGGANLFRVDYFGRDAFLAQSPQFYKQTMVGVFERVYEVGPVFRAEPHETGRHLAEYVSLDAELGFIRDHRDVMDVVRTAVVAMIEAVGERAPADVPVVRFEDVRTGDEPDLSPGGRAPHLRGARRARLRRGLPDVEATVLHASRPGAAGVVARLRPALPRARDRHGRPAPAPVRGLRRGARRAGMDAEPFASYLDAFRYGMPPHGGFALGPRALRRAGGRRGERPRDDALPA